MFGEQLIPKITAIQESMKKKILITADFTTQITFDEVPSRSLSVFEYRDSKNVAFVQDLLAYTECSGEL